MHNWGDEYFWIVRDFVVAADDDSEAVPYLVEHLKDPEHARDALKLLAETGPAGARAIPAILELVETTYSGEYAQGEVANALGKLGISTPEVQSALMKMARDGNHQSAASAMDALVKIGPADVPRLLSAVAQREEWREPHAPYFLKKLADRATAVRALSEMLDAKATRTFAALCLCTLEPSHEAGREALVEQAAGGEHYAQAAMAGLGHKDARVVPALVARLLPRHEKVREGWRRREDLARQIAAICPNPTPLQACLTDILLRPTGQEAATRLLRGEEGARLPAERK